MARVTLFTKSYISIMIANFLLSYGFWLLIPVLPFFLKENFSCTESMLGFLLCSYTISELCVRPFSGYILDAFPRKPLYLFFYFLCATLFLGYILAGTLTLFLIIRMIHGGAFGGVSVGGNTLVVDIMPSERRGEGLGYFGLTNNVAMALGPMTGLFLHGKIPYNNIFTIGFLACAIGFLTATVIRTKPKERISRPPLSLDRFILLKGLPVSLSLLLLSIPYGATTNFVAIYAEEIGLNVQTGYFFTLMALGMGLSRIIAGKQVDKGRITNCIHLGFYPVILAFFTLGLCRFSVQWSHTAAAVSYFAVAILLGAGFGAMFPALNNLYINLAPNNQRATATSTYLTAWDIGLGIGILSSGIIAEQFTFYMVYWLGALLCIASMLFFLLKVTPHYHQHKLR